MKSVSLGNLGDRIRQRRKALRMSQKRLAEEVTRRGMNLSQQNVNSIESGIVARPRALPEIASVLETTIEWLQSGIGPEAFGTPDRPRRLPTRNYYPLLQSAHTRDPYIMELVPTHPSMGALVAEGSPYSFQMIGSEMSPAIEDGDEVGVAPRAGLDDGNIDCVFLQKEVGGKRRILVGRLVSEIRTEWLAKHFNPEQHIRLPRDAWIEAHPIAVIKRATAAKKP